MSLNELRCPTCRRLLLKAHISVGVVEVMCVKCDKVIRFTFGMEPPRPPKADWHSASATERQREALTSVSQTG